MGSNLDGDCVGEVEEVELINNDISCTYICRLSDSKLASMDGPILSVHCSVAGNIFIPWGIAGDDDRFYHVAKNGVGCSDTSLFGDISNMFRLESDPSVEEATNRVFRLVNNHVLSHLKKDGTSIWYEMEFYRYKMWQENVL